MTSNELLKTRIKKLAGSEVAGKCVLYVMSRDQRVADNHALLAAQKHATAKKLPLAVVFVLRDKVGVRSREHYVFMLDGLRMVEKKLNELRISFIMLIGDPVEKLLATFGHLEPEAVYFDFNPLRGPRKVTEEIAKKAHAKIFVVDTHNLVPVWVTSEKREVGAYTIRPKIHKKLAEYLQEPEKIQPQTADWPGSVKAISELEELIQDVVKSQKKSKTQLSFVSGEESAHNHLQQFIEEKLEDYAVDRNDPSSGSQSDLSPYLHFGQISSLRVALELQKVAQSSGSDLHFLTSPKMPKPENAESTKQHGIDSLIEEMVVRKELADNYCYYENEYDSIDAAPKWARKSLDDHRGDERDHVYSFEEFDQAQTHDSAWNAAQSELRKTGKMHGYMRMYWAKKVLEWSEHPEQAIDTLIYLNDYYSIDGGDPNGYAGILWSVGGVHDRPWQERKVFGVVRYMNYGGLKRKFDIKAYEQKWLSS